MKATRTLHLERAYEIRCRDCRSDMWDYSLQDLQKNWSAGAKLVKSCQREGSDADVQKLRSLIKRRPDYSL